MTQFKKDNYIDSIIFRRISPFQGYFIRAKQEEFELCNIYKQEIIKNNFFSKKKKQTLKKNTNFWNHYFKLFQPDKRKAASLTTICWVKKSIPWNKRNTGVMSTSWKLQLLESDSIIGLVLLCCLVYPFELWVYCGRITQ